MRKETNFKATMDEVSRRKHDATANLAHFGFGLQQPIQKPKLLTTWSVPVAVEIGTGVLIQRTIEGSQYFLFGV